MVEARMTTRASICYFLPTPCVRGGFPDLAVNGRRR